MNIIWILCALFTLIAFLQGGIAPFVMQATALLLSCTALLARPLQKSANHFIWVIAFSTVIIVALAMIPSPFDFTATRKSQNDMVRQMVSARDSTAVPARNPAPPRFALSRNKAGTARIMILLLACFTTASLSSSLSPRNKQILLASILCAGTLTCVLALTGMYFIPQGRKIWWIFESSGRTPIGCFINRNHFGGFAALLAPLAVSCFLDSLRGRHQVQTVISTASMAALVSAAILSMSRGAWLACATGIMVTLILTFRHTPFRTFLAAAFSVTIIIALSPVVNGGTRFAKTGDIVNTETLAMRVRTWKDSLGIIRDYPIMGCGANAYRMIFPRYRTSSTRKAYIHAENEYIQIAAETGLLGSSAALAIIGILMASLKKMLDEKSKGTCLMPAAGICGSFAALLLHAGFDFPIRFPLYAFTASILAGIPLDSDGHIQRASWCRSTHAMFVTLLLLSASVMIMGKKIHDLDSSGFIEKADPEQLSECLEWSPTSWQAWYHMGNAALIEGTDEATIAFAKTCLANAAFHDPLNYRLWEKIARFKFAINDWNGALSAYRKLKELRSWKIIPELEKLELESHTEYTSE